MRDASDDKLTLFRQHASAQSKKVHSKQEAVAAATVQDQAYQTQADALEVTLASVAGPKFMKRYGGWRGKRPCQDPTPPRC